MVGDKERFLVEMGKAPQIIFGATADSPVRASLPHEFTPCSPVCNIHATQYLGPPRKKKRTQGSEQFIRKSLMYKLKKLYDHKTQTEETDMGISAGEKFYAVWFKMNPTTHKVRLRVGCWIRRVFDQGLAAFAFTFYLLLKSFVRKGQNNQVPTIPLLVADRGGLLRVQRQRMAVLVERALQARGGLQRAAQLGRWASL